MHVPVRNAEASPATAITNPYVGLRPYSSDQRELFFGREHDAELLINKIFSSPLTILYAPSGVGKTSLLRTLIVPDLVDPHKHDAYVVYHDFYAEAEPEQAIYTAMERALGGDAALSDGGLLSAARLKPLLQQADRTTVLILDQFEEFLQRHARQPDPLRCDLANLVRAGLNLHIVLAFREEFLAALDACFREYILTIFASTYHLEHLDSVGAKAAITMPAQKFGVTYAPALLTQLLKELQAEPESAGYTILATRADGIDLPFLQIVCSRLWSESFPRGTGATRGGTVTLATFRKLGARRGIVEKYVQEVTGEFSFRERAEAARLLELLAPESGMKMGYPPGMLSQQTKLPQQRVERLLKPLVTRGIVRMRETQSGPIYELSHDAFIKVLRPWVGEVLHRWRLWQGAKSIGGVVLVFLVAGMLYQLYVDDQKCVATADKLAQRAKAALESDPQASLNTAIEATTHLKLVRWPWWSMPYSSGAEINHVLRLAAARAPGGWVLKQAQTETLDAVFSSDGKVVLTGSASGRVHLNSAEGDSPGHKFEIGDGEVTAFAFSRDGKLIAVAADNKVHVWTLAAGTPQRLPYELDHRGVHTIAISADARVVVTGGDDKLAKLWDASTGEFKAKSAEHAYLVRSVAVSPKGKYIATGSGDGVTSLWDGDFTWLHSLKGPDKDVVSIDFSADGRWLATAGLEDEKAHVWEIANKSWKHFMLIGHSDAVNTVQFQQDRSNFIVTASEDKTARVWDSTSGRQLAVLSGHREAVSRAAFSPDGKRIVTVGKEPTVKVWNFDDITWTSKPRTSERRAPSMPLSNDVRIEINPMKFEVLVINDHITAQRKLDVRPSDAASVAYEPSARVVATGGKDGVVRLWSADTGQLIDQAEVLPKTAISSLAFSNNGTRLVSAGQDGTAILWSWEGARLERKRTIEASQRPISGAAFSPDSTLVVTARAEFSPDGKYVVTVSADGTARIWSVEDGSWWLPLRDPTEPVPGSAANAEGPHGLADATFSPDSALVVTAGFDGHARIYDARTGDLVSKLPTANVPLSTVRFATEGQRTLIETYSGKLAVPQSGPLGWRGAQFTPHGRFEIVERNDQKRTYDCEIWCKPQEAVIELAKRRKTLELEDR